MFFWTAPVRLLVKPLVGYPSPYSKRLTAEKGTQSTNTNVKGRNANQSYPEGNHLSSLAQNTSLFPPHPEHPHPLMVSLSNQMSGLARCSPTTPPFILSTSPPPSFLRRQEPRGGGRAANDISEPMHESPFYCRMPLVSVTFLPLTHGNLTARHPDHRRWRSWSQSRH